MCVLVLAPRWRASLWAHSKRKELRLILRRCHASDLGRHAPADPARKERLAESRQPARSTRLAERGGAVLEALASIVFEAGESEFGVAAARGERFEAATEGEPQRARNAAVRRFPGRLIA